jgi:hypothetical protein
MKTPILAGSLILLLSAQRLPAPIEEETPSPSPASTVSAAPSAAALSKQEAARFAGTWTGKIKFGGNPNEVEYTLMVNPEATSLIMKSLRFGEFARSTTLNGNALRWTAGPKNGNVWTLAPNPDGQTALVKAKPAAGAEGNATFQRTKFAPKREHAGGRLKGRQ